MKKIYAFLFVIILGASMVSSLSCETILLGKDSIVGIEIPNEIPFTNEVFNIYISDKFFMNINLVEKSIDELNCLENEDGSYDILIKSYSVFEDFVKSDNFLDTFLEAKKSKDIQIKGKSFGKKTKLFFVNIGLKIFGWFN